MKLALCVLAIVFSFLIKVDEVKAQAFTRDENFQLDYNFFGPGSGKSVYNVLFLPNDKLLVYGNYGHAVFNNSVYGIVRFFSNGQVDSSFDPPNNISLEHTAYMRPTDYGYWVVGDFNIPYKLDFNGQRLDQTYTTNYLNDIGVCSFSKPVFLSDGSCLVGGGFCGYPSLNSTMEFHMVRILPNGHIDTTMGHQPNHQIYFLERYDNTKIMASGFFTHFDGVMSRLLCRIDTLGNIDTTFTSIFTNGFVRPTYVQDDGKIIITGEFTRGDNPDTLHMVRLHPDGSLDTTFNNFNNLDTTPGNYISSICKTSDGGYLLGGSFTNYQNYARGNLVKTDANGFIEAQYLTGSGIDTAPPFSNLGIRVHSIKRGPNDQYYITGGFAGFNGDSVQPIIRLNGPQTVGLAYAEAKKPAITLQPNPATDKVYLHNPTNQSGTVTFYDITGRQMLQWPFSGAQEPISVSELPQGLYVVTITDNDGEQWQQKLLIQH